VIRGHKDINVPAAFGENTGGQVLKLHATPEPLAAALAVGEVLEVVWGVRHVLNTLARNDHFNRWGSVFKNTFGGLG
jgi:hypothetical protein